MPELPEAETIARQLHAGLAGRVFGRVRLKRKDIVFGDPRPLGRLLTGRRVDRVHRRAKRVVVDLTPSAQLVFCLGMTGRLTLCDAEVPVERHTHLRIAIDGSARELRFRDPRRFGGIWCETDSGGSRGRKLSPLGPEPLQLTAAQFRRMLARPRQIKAALMDQGFIAGLGNIYCDEALHAARIHPLTRADSLDVRTADGLLRAIKGVLRRAIRHGGSTLMDYRTAEGAPGYFQIHHRVYQRAGEPCRSCRTPIERIQAAGRSTFICSSCQSRHAAEPAVCPSN